MNRDLYIKIVREKVFRSCDLMIKNVTHLKTIDFKLYIYSFSYVYALKKSQKNDFIIKICFIQ